MKALIGVIPESVLRKRITAIAAGKYKPQEGEPKVWFSSLNALGQVLSNENIALLRLMDEQKPQTITELAEMSGRQVSNLSSTLKTLCSHGFVSLEKTGRTVKPKAIFTDFIIIIDQSLSESFEAA